MNFNSLQYLLFLPITVVLYFILPRRIKKPMLLVAGFFFYCCWEPAYALLMLLSIGATFGCALLMERAPQNKRLWLALCLLLNLGLLFFFKYFNFAAQALADLCGLAGLSVAAPRLNLLLPIGISFYTFQALGYTIDVYRGSAPAERNFIDYALFVSFFPQLVAGPIERSGNILPQLKEPQPFRFSNLRDGASLILWGMMKKVLIADHAAAMVHTAYGDLSAFGGKQLLFATLCFAIQIYCDFSAYSDIARGSARLFGIRLMKNFDCPYFAQSIKDFWRRWHISLSAWLKDYLYFPLGGSRRGMARTCLNLLIVFAISGLWHGAAFPFLLWGLLHGLYLVIGRLLRPLKERLYRHIPERHPLLAAVRILATFGLICLGWVLFRADSLGGALLILQKIFAFSGEWNLTALGLSPKMLLVLVLAIGAMLALEWLNRKGAIARLLRHRPFLRYGAWLLLLLAMLVFGYYGPGFDPMDFVYFQF